VLETFKFHVLKIF